MQRRQPETRPRRRELSRRAASGLEVVLYWCGHKSAVTLAVHDELTGEAFEVEVAGADALDAFRHPYAYARGAKAPSLADA